MSQTILIEPNDELRRIFSLNLSTFAITDVITRKDAQETIDLIAILPAISLVVVRNRVGHEKTASLIFDYIEKEQLNIPVLVLGLEQSLENKTICLEDPINVELIVQSSLKLLGLSPEDIARRTQSQYSSIPTNYFYDIYEVPCDVFIKARIGAGEYQFIRKIHSKDKFDALFIKKIEEQGIRELYVQSDYQQYFTTYITNSIVKKLDQLDLAMEERILTTARSYTVLSDHIRKIGLDETMIELADAGINSMISSIKNQPQLNELLRVLFSSKISLAYQRCHLITILCQYILSKQSWYQPKHLEILSYAAFFSDITLKSQTQILINSLEDVKNTLLGDQEYKDVLEHAHKASQIIHHHSTVDELVKTIILEHHGVPAQDHLLSEKAPGFIDNPGEGLHPLSKVFIVADTFVKIFLSPDQPTAKKDILPLLYQRFTHPSYQKIIRSLEMKFDLKPAKNN